ncbi:hypothetical protein [Rossellomorea vietnamensis]|uniref:hypothetical protein n=1 Tax=Rossellomorea vietnamensis TaxID=218284 RepID=UPI000A5EC1CD|nr:hypothetical protein [Rossellomorea vietnamensis]
MRNSLYLIVFSLLIVLAGCGLETKTLTEFYEKDLNDVTKIVIVDGSTGFKKTITDNNKIEELLSEIKDIKFIPDENQEKREGWRYSIALYQQDERTFQFTMTEIDEHYYHTEPDIFPIVNEMYESIDVQEE